MLGLALSVAIGVAIVLWSQEPSYGRLYSEIGESDVTEILEILNEENIKYKVETGSGAIMVPMDEVSAIKLKLAAQGLPKSNSMGYELLDKDQGFGASKSVETVRFQRALEGEIARTIMSIQNVKTVRAISPSKARWKRTVSTLLLAPKPYLLQQLISQTIAFGQSLR